MAGYTLDDLDAAIAKLRYVKYGDYVTPEDHNSLVECIKIIADLYECPKLNEILPDLREVFKEDIILPDDHNNLVDAIKAERDCIAEVKDTSELDSIIAKLRKVKEGDYVLNSDHNDLVDAIKAIRALFPIIVKVWSPPTGFSWRSWNWDRYNRNYNPFEGCTIAYISDGSSIHIIRFKGGRSTEVHSFTGVKSPVVGDDGTLYVPNGDTITAIDGATYQTKWSKTLQRFKPDYTPEIYDMCLDGFGNIYVLLFEESPDGWEVTSLQKLKEADGTIEWAINLSTYLPLGLGRPSTHLTHSEKTDRLYFAMHSVKAGADLINQFPPRVYCVNSDGEVEWTYELRYVADPATDSYSAECVGDGIAVDDDDNLYFGTHYYGVNPPLKYRGIYCLDKNGNPKWYLRNDESLESYNAELSPITANLIRVAPSIDKNGNIYFSPDENVYGNPEAYFESRTSDGAVRWYENIYDTPLAGYIFDSTTPCIIKRDPPDYDLIYVGTSGRRLHGFNETGTHFLNIAASNDAMIYFVTSKKGDGVVWTASNDGAGTYYISVYDMLDGSLVYEISSTTLWSKPVLVNSYAFEKVADCPDSLYACTEAGGKGYVVNYGASKLYEYDPETDTWAEKAAPPIAGAGNRYFFFFFGIGDKVYLAGGSDLYGTVFYTDVWEYDPSTDTWRQLGDTPQSMFVKYGEGHPYVDENYAYLPCLIDYTGYIRLYRYDPSTDTWTRLADCPASPRYAYAIAGRIIAGGYDFATNNPLSDCYMYDPETDTWSQIADIPESGQGVFGYDLHVALETSRMIYRYDPTTNAWVKKALYIGIGSYPNVQPADQRSWLISGKAYFATWGGEAPNIWSDVLRLRLD